MTSSDHTLLNISHEDLKHTHIYKFFQGENAKKKKIRLPDSWKFCLLSLWTFSITFTDNMFSYSSSIYNLFHCVRKRNQHNNIKNSLCNKGDMVSMVLHTDITTGKIINNFQKTNWKFSFVTHYILI